MPFDTRAKRFNIGMLYILSPDSAVPSTVFLEKHIPTKVGSTLRTKLG